MEFWIPRQVVICHGAVDYGSKAPRCYYYAGGYGSRVVGIKGPNDKGGGYSFDFQANHDHRESSAFHFSKKGRLQGGSENETGGLEAEVGGWQNGGEEWGTRWAGWGVGGEIISFGW